MPGFATLTLIIFLSILYGRADSMRAIPMVLVRLPSTLLHELSHLAAALITFAKPTDIDITPRRSPAGGWVLGSVQCGRLNWFTAFPVGMAPILINLPLAWWAYNQHTTPGYVWAYFLLTASLPSEQDLKIALQNLIAAVAWIGGLLFVAKIFGADNRLLSIIL